MNILYLHQHFAVSAGSTGTRSYEFARRWVAAGHKITVITGHYDIGGLSKPSSVIEKREIDGIKIIITGTTYSNKHSFMRRIFSFISFMFLSLIAGWRVKNVDMIYATSTPLTIGIPAMILKRLKRVPFVFEVRDQWPEIPIELGIIKNPVLKKVLLWLEKRIYQSSSGIIALSPGMAAGVREIIGSDKPITIASNCSDIDVFRPDIDGSSIREKHSWDNKCVLLHAGAMGKVNGLTFILDAAKRLSEYKDILFVLIGEGREREKLQEQIHKEKIDNVQILPAVSKSDLPDVFAAVDIGMVIIGDYPAIEHNSANKFFDSLAAGKPVLLNYSGWQREVIEDNNAGLGCELANIDEFVSNVKKLYEDSQLRKEMSCNARKLAENKFSRDILAGKVLKTLENII
jgi:glycosyltransferase involved in cell wall biosynthesis